jgi:mRNA-degrading endonuclease RelE of RelBE toxin-antitoxin system
MAKTVPVREFRNQASALLGLLERDPAAGHVLLGRLRGPRSLRVGSYRIIYQLAESERTVRVVATPHRSIAYRNDPG